MRGPEEGSVEGLGAGLPVMDGAVTGAFAGGFEGLGVDATAATTWDVETAGAAAGAGGVWAVTRVIGPGGATGGVVILGS